ncbi:TetR/AcrR family transcriptional regulator [Nocardia sp. NPDC059246]|uniref:TetR/AcrR family transcriptional regulator n=1 Tax=unclassified Nocardia TaxID=2637762 RepID=UPI0036802E87
MAQPAFRNSNSATIERIVHSARECFMHKGVRSTRIADIAAGAGMVRQTVYDSVSGRDEILDLAMIARARELADVVRARHLNPRASVTDQIVERLATMIETVRGDVEFRHLSDAVPPDHAFRLLTGPSALTAVTTDLVAPLFGHARTEGLLRTDVDIDELAGWVQMVLAPLMVREDLTPPALRRILRLFILPALVDQRT